MKALLWKELRERRLWLLPLLLSTLAVVLLRCGYTFCGFPNNYIIPSAFLALLFGMTTYSGELGTGTVDFLYAKPASWKKVLLAKLIVGLGFVVATALAATAVYRLMLPGVYADFAGPLELAKGTGLAIAVMGVPYLFGFACSVVLPGMVGGVLVFLSVSVLCGMLYGLFERTAKVGRTMEDAVFLTIVLAACFVASLAAAVFTTRFGLTLGLATRVRRHILVMLPVLALTIVPTAHLVHASWDQEQLYDGSVSPDGRYEILVRYIGLHRRNLDPWDRMSLAGEAILVRLADGSSVKLGPDRTNWEWVGNVAYSECVGLDVPGDLSLAKVQPGGSVRQHTITVPARSHASDAAPDNRVLALVTYEGSYWQTRLLVRFVDLHEARLLDMVIRNVDSYRWRSSTEIEYTDIYGKRRVVEVK